MSVCAAYTYTAYRREAMYEQSMNRISQKQKAHLDIMHSHTGSEGCGQHKSICPYCTFNTCVM